MPHAESHHYGFEIAAVQNPEFEIVNYEVNSDQLRITNASFGNCIRIALRLGGPWFDNPNSSNPEFYNPELQWIISLRFSEFRVYGFTNSESTNSGWLRSHPLLTVGVCKSLPKPLDNKCESQAFAKSEIALLPTACQKEDFLLCAFALGPAVHLSVQTFAPTCLL